MVVYRNGFVVDDGPLRTLEDPANQQFMESLAQGFCPQELVENGQPADVKLENRLQEEFNPRSAGSRGAAAPGRNFAAFDGAGAAVGEIALSAASSITPGTSGSGSAVNWNEAGGDKIRVQIKFPDGKKEVAKFDKGHTIRHLITVVESIRPDMGPYLLLSGSRGPPKPIESSDFDQSLVDAGLAGAVVTVKETN